MLKKLPLAAAIAICAAFPASAYASSIGSAVGNAISTGGEIMDDTFDAGRDILNGFSPRDTEGDATLEGENGTGTDNNDPADTVPGGDNNDNNTGTSDPAPDNTTSSGDNTASDNNTASGDQTVSGGNTSSEETASGGNESMAGSANNPSTGVTTLGYTAVAAVLAAMGVMTTAVRRKDD